ncbi:putative NBD/HSP70 family sugar kinase [Microbacterium keratanolyticum]|uniref:ROK family protein n=1 Tax=Microbacterium keratanolyticum TaxID=67574 RepID=A0A9W6HR89_9MICO|nr:ROK family protein [Microbacterium keratanolyticum]MBM7468572.1 putative NBD/HSP70 family sugar kinase [Microbacterium keratanolyticum]GLK00649.1 hypothetical protein GCM10017596_03640 [Microbacterium keratanolyticum]
MTGLLIGIDLGGTKMHVGAVRADATAQRLSLEAERVVPTPSGGGVDLLDALVTTVSALRDEVGVGPVVAIGLGGAGVPQADGGFSDAPNLGDVEFDLVAALGAHFTCPVTLDNDANVAAIGELVAAATTDSFAYVAVGTGIGMGLVLGGELVRGARGAAGEIGYLPLGADPLDPAHHRRGALEEAVAGDVLAARDSGARNVREVFDRAAAGQPDAVAAVDAQARWIAYALASVIAVVDPGAFVLGGGIGSREELRAPIQQWLARLGHPDVPLRISTLGSAGAVLGAIELARRSMSSLTGASA